MVQETGLYEVAQRKEKNTTCSLNTPSQFLVISTCREGVWELPTSHIQGAFPWVEQ